MNKNTFELLVSDHAKCVKIKVVACGRWSLIGGYEIVSESHMNLNEPIGCDFNL